MYIKGRRAIFGEMEKIFFVSVSQRRSAAPNKLGLGRALIFIFLTNKIYLVTITQIESYIFSVNCTKNIAFPLYNS